MSFQPTADEVALGAETLAREHYEALRRVQHLDAATVPWEDVAPDRRDEFVAAMRALLDRKLVFTAPGILGALGLSPEQLDGVRGGPRLDPLTEVTLAEELSAQGLPANAAVLYVGSQGLETRARRLITSGHFMPGMAVQVDRELARDAWRLGRPAT